MHADTLSQLVKVRHFLKQKRARGETDEDIMEKLASVIKSTLK